MPSKKSKPQSLIDAINEWVSKERKRKGRNTTVKPEPLPNPRPNKKQQPQLLTKATYQTKVPNYSDMLQEKINKLPKPIKVRKSKTNPQ
jgi:hypothetical protein